MKIPIALDDLEALASASVRNGTEGNFIDLALEWAKQAQNRIDDLEKNLNLLCVSNNIEHDTTRYEQLIEDLITFYWMLCGDTVEYNCSIRLAYITDRLAEIIKEYNDGTF
jgi:hypothetical protein